jgi:hypothetical protein
MAERKSGPVKPPVIDLTARPAGPTGPGTGEAAKPAPGGGEPKKPEPRKPASPPAETLPPEGRPAETGAEPPASAGSARPRAPEPAHAAPDGHAAGSERRPLFWLGPASGLVGAAVAVAICYGLAAAGYWPSVPDSRIDDLVQRLTEVEQAGTTNGTALADLDSRFRSLQADFAAKLAAAATSLAQVQQSLGKRPDTDLAPLQAELKTLASRVDAVAAGASSADAGALAANLSALQQQVSGLADKLGAVDAHLTHTDSDVTGLKTSLAAAKAAIDQAAAAPSPKAIAAAVQMPLLIAALDADFASGRPYRDDLQRLTAAAPETRVPAPVADAAANGLPAASDFVRAFEAKMPDMLAALPGGTDSSWQGRAADWLRGILAVRPAGEQAGDTPAALLSRVESAVERRDFATAATLFGQLPQPVRDAAGPVGGELTGLAAAESFIADLRTTALAPIGAAS